MSDHDSVAVAAGSLPRRGIEERLHRPDGLLRATAEHTLKRHARNNEDRSVGLRKNQPSRDRWSVHFSGSSFGMRAKDSSAGWVPSSLPEVTSGDRKASRKFCLTTLGCNLFSSASSSTLPYQHVSEDDGTAGGAVHATFQSGNDGVFDFGSRNSG
jgi:hypothetical protein